jgi:small GTP-binding protein
MAETDKVKIVIFGAYGAGKSTLIKTIDPDSKHIEANCAGGTTTVALDYGRAELCGRHIHFFGTPGQERFEFAREIVGKGMDGAVLLVDATAGIDELTQHLYDSLCAAKIPFLVMINKCDMDGARPAIFKQAFTHAVVCEASAMDRRQAINALGAFASALPPHPGNHLQDQ